MPDLREEEDKVSSLFRLENGMCWEELVN